VPQRLHPYGKQSLWQLMPNTGSLEERCLCDQVFLKLFFPGTASLPVLLRWRFFLKGGYITSHEKYSFSQKKKKKKFTFISLIHSIWHNVLQSIVLSLKMNLEQRKPKPGLKRDRNRYSQGIPGSTVTFFVLYYSKFLLRRLFFF